MIHSESLQLRKTTEEDLEFVLAAEQAQHNCAFIGQWSKEEHRAALHDLDMLHLIIIDALGELTGYVIVTGLLDPNFAVCIKRIVIESKGLGYGKLTLRLLSDWIFQNTATHRLWLDVKDHNERARHVYEGAGFIFEGMLRDCVKVEKGFESLLIMSILRTEYLSRKT
ncbi:GNAT family N-acetyltransferase [Paenibacillus wynnii]|uniref:GNAT family N-acetyltransferase n=1 Tax=Paenibacillus wynnii TaxID=268407 RepID=UPI002793AE3B|nr:GNAT family protein [Paenibacillus wynnii]MDQ0192321.1 RimJ/RimL family protein N-acetyltransferase [Paenibacillus wynnii]